MIYYPFSTLMLTGIRDILLISTPQDTPRFEQLLGDGSKWGLNSSYAVQPSPGGLEIAVVSRVHLKRQELSVEVFGCGVAWLGTGTHEALRQASNFVETLEKRQDLKIACPEEIAYRLGDIDAAKLSASASPFGKSEYGQYLNEILGDPPGIRS